MDGVDSHIMHYFKSLIIRGIMELRKHQDSLVKIIEITSFTTGIQCFKDTNQNSILINSFKDRFLFGKSEKELISIVDKWIENSYNNWRTTYYDKYQYYTNGYMP